MQQITRPPRRSAGTPHEVPSSTSGIARPSRRTSSNEPFLRATREIYHHEPTKPPLVTTNVVSGLTRWTSRTSQQSERGSASEQVLGSRWGLAHERRVMLQHFELHVL